jgi:hypothetical protein
MALVARDSQLVIQGDTGLYARLLADESDGPVRALESLSEVFSSRGRAPPHPKGISYIRLTQDWW